MGNTKRFGHIAKTNPRVFGSSLLQDNKNMVCLNFGYTQFQRVIIVLPKLNRMSTLVNTIIDHPQPYHKFISSTTIP